MCSTRPSFIHLSNTNSENVIWLPRACPDISRSIVKIAYSIYSKYSIYNFEKRLQMVLEDPLKLVNPGVHASYVKVLMGGTCTGYAMKDGKNCIICKGIHGDECRKWPYCRVS